MINYHKTTLSNGLRIITAPMKQTKAVTVMIGVGAGSRYEEKEQNGLSHFLEHLFFKGTKKRPTTLDITREMDAVGASYNAFTSEEETDFYVRAPSDHLDLSLDILNDILFSSKFDPREIEKEKKVILEEIKMYRDIPQRYVQDLAKELFYGQSALGRPVAGREETIKRLSQKDFFSYRDRLYTPDNLVIAVAGSQEKFDWLKEISKKLGNVGSRKEVDWQAVKEKQRKPASLVYYKKTDQAHLVLGLRSFSRHDERRPILKVINNILGDTMSSWLFTEVREKRALAYYVGSDFSEFHDVGSLCVSAGVDLKRIEEAIKVILEQFRRIKKGISRKELERAKENLKGRLYLSLEDSFSVAEFLADQELLWEKIKTPEEIVEEVYKVKLSDIIELSQEIFRSEKLNLAIVGPYKDKRRFDGLLKV